MGYKTLEKQLFISARKNDVKKVSYILKMGANVFAVEHDKTVLDIAIKNGNEELIKVIKEGMVESFNKKINEKSGAGFIRTICRFENENKEKLTEELYYAIFEEDTEEALSLIDRGADVDFIPEDQYSTALVRAIEFEQYDIAKKIIEKGCDVNYVDRYGDNALALACKKDNIELVKMLVEDGANINRTKRQKGNFESPLYAASICGNIDIIKYLVEHGADVNVKDDDGTTPLFNSVIYGAFHSDLLEQVCYFIDNGADINARTNSKKETVLYYAVSGEHADVVAKLLDNNVDINDENAIIRATSLQSDDILNMLIEKGADVKSVNNFNLMDKANKNNLKLLLDYGVDIDAKDDKGETAFLHSVSRGDIEKVERLVELGCNTDVVNNDGKSWKDLLNNEDLKKNIKDIIKKHKKAKNNNQSFFDKMFSRD